MKVDIEEYRGWQISFDTEKETFYCVSDAWDRDESKKSFAAIKSFIDEFIKDNLVFKPVWAEPSAGRHGRDKIKIIGIRKDGRLICEKNGEKSQLSSYDEEGYIIHNPANDPIRNQIDELDLDIEKLYNKKKELDKQITGQSLSDFKKQFIQ